MSWFDKILDKIRKKKDNPVVVPTPKPEPQPEPVVIPSPPIPEPIPEPEPTPEKEYQWTKHALTVKNLANKNLKPELVEKVKKVLNAMEDAGYQPAVWEGYRTKAQQKEKVDKGYSTTMNSKHCKGLAVDIVDKRHLWNINYVHPFWSTLGRAYEEHGLRWGGVWKLGKARWPIIEKAIATNKPKLIDWFFDGAHGELDK